MVKNKIAVGLRIDENTHKKITFIAKKENRSFNNFVEFLAISAVKEYEEKHGKINL